MAKVGLAGAAKLTGKSQSTIHRAMASRKLSFEKTDDGERVIDTAELHRVFPIKMDVATANNVCDVMDDIARHVTQSDVLAVKLEAATARITDLQGQIDGLKADKEGLRRENTELLSVVKSQSEHVRQLTHQPAAPPVVPVAPPSRTGWWLVVAGVVALAAAVAWWVQTHPLPFAA